MQSGKQHERSKLDQVKIDKQGSQLCEGGNPEKQAKQWKREQQRYERDHGKEENIMEEMEGERRTHQGEKKEEKQNSETEQGSENVNVSQDKKDTPINFNQKRAKAEGGNEAYKEHISKNDTGKQKHESHGKARQEKQVKDCRGTQHSQLSNGVTKNRNKETKEGNSNALQEKRSRDTRKTGTSVFWTVVLPHQ